MDFDGTIESDGAMNDRICAGVNLEMELKFTRPSSSQR